MPASREALRLTDNYRAQLLLVRQRVVQVSLRLWAGVDREKLDESFARWVTATSVALEASQRRGIALTDAYLSAYIAAELGDRQLPPPRAENPAGTGRDGRDLTQVLAPPLYTVKMALAQGQPNQTALQAGLARAARTIAVEMMAAPRAAMDEAISRDKRIVGWRRVTSGNACGACLAAATGAIHEDSEALDVHGHCRCTKEPVIRDVRERFRRPTGREIFDGMSPSQQDALFAGRGGAEKAELLRTGQVPFEALIHRQSMATVADEITEAPLAALRS